MTAGRVQTAGSGIIGKWNYSSVPRRCAVYVRISPAKAHRPNLRRGLGGGRDPEGRRAVPDDALAGVTVKRGGGRRTREQQLARLAFDWRGPAGPVPEPDEEWS